MLKLFVIVEKGGGLLADSYHASIICIFEGGGC